MPKYKPLRGETLPPYLPDLLPDDFVIGPMDKGCRHCLAGWCKVLNLPDSVWLLGSSDKPDVLDRAIYLVEPRPKRYGLTNYKRTNTSYARRLAAKAWVGIQKELGYVHDVGTMTLP